MLFARSRGVLDWACPVCNTVHKTRLKLGEYSIRCNMCDHQWLVGIVFYAKPSSTVKAPRDTLMIADGFVVRRLVNRVYCDSCSKEVIATVKAHNKAHEPEDRVWYDRIKVPTGNPRGRPPGSAAKAASRAPSAFIASEWGNTQDSIAESNAGSSDKALDYNDIERSSQTRPVILPDALPSMAQYASTHAAPETPTYTIESSGRATGLLHDRDDNPSDSIDEDGSLHSSNG